MRVLNWFEEIWIIGCLLFVTVTLFRGILRWCTGQRL